MGWANKDRKIRAIDGLEWSIYGVDVLFTTNDEWCKVGLRNSLMKVRSKQVEDNLASRPKPRILDDYFKHIEENGHE